MADSDQSIPPWVPEIAPGVHADVYPVEPLRTSPEPYCNSPAELRLDRSAVTTGYSERRQAYEFASCLPASVSDAKPIPSAPLSSAVPSDASSVHLSSAHATGGLSVQDLSKIRGGLGMLRRSRPTKLQRVALQTFATPPLPSDPAASSLETPSFASKKSFPLQKPSASSSLEDWFNKLSSGASFSTSQLSRSVPLGPAIVRAAGKVIEMMATRSVPTQRAAWYIRIAVLNECVKQIRPDRPPPSPRSFWTRQLCMLLKTEIDAIRARKTAMLGSMDRAVFWDYVLDLARWQADEVLLDLPAWLSRIASILRTELQTSQSFASPGTKIALSAARRFLPEFLANAFSARQLCDALLPGAVAIAKVRRLPSPSSHVKGGAQRKVSAKRAASIANPCHAEVTTLLSAALYVLDEATGSAESGVRINDLEVLVKRTMQVLTPGENKQKVEVSAAKMEATLLAGSSDIGKAANYCAGQQEDNTISEHLIMREFEKIPSHGDVPRVTKKIHEAFKPRGGLRAAVKFVCEWAVEGPAGDRAEAILVGAAIVAQLAFENSRHTSSLGLKRNADPSQMLGKPSAKIKSTANDAAWTPPLQREIWQFMKDRSEGRDLHNLGTTDHTVRFMAQLCRLEQLSLPVFVRDVSRLVSLGHAGCAYLVKCLSLLPDPADKSVADSRRSLLRKFGYLVVSQRSGQQQGFDEKVVDAACSGDMAIMEKEAEALLKSEKPGVILGTAETVRLEDLSTTFACSGLELSNRLYSISSFMIYIDEPGLAVEWVLDHLGEIVQGTGRWADQALVSKKGEAFLTLLRIVEDLARYVAACGQLDTIFHLMKKAWLSSWSTSAIRKAILYSQAAYAKMFSASSGNGSMYWTTLAARNLQQMALNWPSSNQLIPLVLANVRGQIVDRAAEETSVAEILSKSRTENLGPTPDQDLTYLKTQDCMYGLSVSEIRDGFAKTESTFAVNDYFLKGFTANDIFGSVFIPVMIGALNDPIEDASPEDFFSRLAAFAVQVIDAWQNDVRLQGVRPAIVVEFIALLIAGCLCGHSDTSNSLEMLVGMRWVWKILAPAAGIKLAQRLRDRVEHYCEKIGAVDKVVLSAMLFNMVTRFSGEASRDEATVASALGTEPLGMIEMQLSLLAAHRRECGEDEEFGARIADAAVSLISGDSARTLASTALLCCTHEESKHIVAGLVGYGAVRAMAESLGFVVKGLTVEASKNSSLHRERAGQWYQADIGRRGVLECIVESLSQEVGVQVETVLFDQLVTVTSQLSAAHSRNCMPSSLVEDGRRISDALESRLNCVLRSQRTAQASDVWIQRTIQVASLMRVAVPLMKSNAVSASLDVLKLCLKHLGECEKAEGKGAPAVESLSEVVERFDKNDLKGQLKSLLTPILFWVEESESTFICSLFGQRNSAHGREHAVRVLNADGGDIDRWVLLEGYGRGTDEDAAIHPSTFSRQGEGSVEGVEATPSVQLKRTYATFASLAV